MTTLVTTPGAVNANSYTSLLEALDHVGTLTFVKGWPAGEAEQEALLKQAFRKMNTLDFRGTRTAPEEAQAGAFPRWGICDRDGFLVPSNVIPRAVKPAQIDLAIWLGAKNRNIDAAPARLKIGGLEIEGQTAQEFPDHVLAQMAPYLKSYGNNIRLERA